MADREVLGGEVELLDAEYVRQLLSQPGFYVTDDPELLDPLRESYCDLEDPNPRAHYSIAPPKDYRETVSVRRGDVLGDESAAYELAKWQARYRQLAILESCHGEEFFAWWAIQPRYLGTLDLKR